MRLPVSELGILFLSPPPLPFCRLVVMTFSVGTLLGVAGGAAGAASYHLYDEENMDPFRLFCLCAAGLSSIGFWYTGTRLDVSRLEGLNVQVRFRRRCAESLE